MSTEITQLEYKKQDYQMRLGKLLKDKSPDKDLKTYRDEIVKITDKQYALSFRKTSLLQYSIESKTMVHVYSFLTCLITQKKIKEEWVQAWKNIDELEKSDEELITKISIKASLLIGQLNIVFSS